MPSEAVAAAAAAARRAQTQALGKAVEEVLDGGDDVGSGSFEGDSGIETGTLRNQQQPSELRCFYIGTHSTADHLADIYP